MQQPQHKTAFPSAEPTLTLDDIPSIQRGLLDLPQELIDPITDSMDLDDVKQLSLVNKKLRYHCRPRLFGRITLQMHTAEDSVMRDRIRCNYHNFRFARHMVLYVGFKESFEYEDLTVALEDFAASFALLQGYITDISYELYARSDPTHNAIDRALISGIMTIITDTHRIKHIRAHLYTGSDFQSWGGPRTSAQGLLPALPYFSTSHHIHSIVVNGEYMDYTDFFSDILPAFPPQQYLTYCRFSHWTLPDNDLELLPRSLEHIYLSIEEWDNFGSASWLRAMKKLQKACPQVTTLKFNIRHGMTSIENPDTIEVLLSETTPSNLSLDFANLEGLVIYCDPYSAYQPALQQVFMRLNAPNLTDLTVEGPASWFCISSLNLDVFVKSTKLETVTFTDILGKESMTEDCYPWSDTYDVLAISQPLFQYVVDHLKAAGVDLTITAMAETNRTHISGFHPNYDGFRIPLATVQDHVQHLEFQYVYPDDKRTDDVERLIHGEPYFLPCLRSIEVEFNIPHTFSDMASTLHAPNLEELIVYSWVKDTREAASMVRDLTAVVDNQSFPKLNKLTGWIWERWGNRKAQADTNTSVLEAFVDACARRHIDISELYVPPLDSLVDKSRQITASTSAPSNGIDS